MVCRIIERRRLGSIQPGNGRRPCRGVPGGRPRPSSRFRNRPRYTATLRTSAPTNTPGATTPEIAAETSRPLWQCEQMFSAVDPITDIRHSMWAAENFTGRQLISRLLAQATDRGVAHVIGPRDFRKHLSRLPASNGFPALMASQFWLSTKNYSPRLRALAPLAGSRSD